MFAGGSLHITIRPDGDRIEMNGIDWGRNSGGPFSEDGRAILLKQLQRVWAWFDAYVELLNNFTGKYLSKVKLGWAYR